VRKDYKVDFRTEKTIKSLSNEVRIFLDPTFVPAFRIVDSIRKLCAEEILSCGKIDFELYRMSGDDPFAYVTFFPKRTLHVDRDVWDEAEYNIPDARFILGHELGHLIMHDHHVQRFSGEKGIAWQEENSAEWQADTFSDHVLVSDDEVRRFVTPNAISNHCAVNRDLALRRLGKKFRYFGDSCQNCGHLALVAVGPFLKCDNCHFEFG
jgi:hypothetical protein